MFKAYVPQQGELLPAHVGEALDPSDPALFIDDLVESLDLLRFEKRVSPAWRASLPASDAVEAVASGGGRGRVQRGGSLRDGCTTTCGFATSRLGYDRTSGRSTDSGTVTTGTSERCSCRR